MKIKYFGYAGHFIGAPMCLFIITTQVGNYLISSVGDYRPKGCYEKQEIVGGGKLFETMVFMTTENKCELSYCNCNMPEVVKWTPIDTIYANTAGEAQNNHEKMIKKYKREVIKWTRTK